MTNRERVIASLEHRQPDKTPYCIGFTQKAHAKMVDYYGDPGFEPKLGNCFTMLKTVRPDAWQEIRPDLWRDQFGVLWDRSVDKDIGNVVNRLVTAENVAGFAPPDPRDPVRFTAYPKTVEEKGDRFYIAEIGFSLFERAWVLAGMEPLLEATMCDPDFVHTLLDKILAYNLEIIDGACRYPIDAMYFGDDWGSQRGLLMGRERWREFIEPRVRQMYRAVKDLFPDLIADGLDVFNPFQPEVIDVFGAKRKYGAELCFFGGISTQRILPYATPEETRDHVKRLIEGVGKDGGLFAAPAHAIPPDAKMENMAAMIEVLQNQ
jgi:uroporphyrinogen decarboxylase